MNNLSFQVKRLVQLALPIFIAQVTQTMMGFLDTVMAGRVSALDMAAVAIGTSLWIPALLFVQGLLLAFTPVFAHYHGANNQQSIQALAFQAGYIAIIGSLGVILFLSFAENIFIMMDLEPEMTRMSLGYLHGFSWGVPVFVLYHVLRGCCEGISYTFPTMIIGFVVLAVNIPANYIFIYGHLDMPAMGGAGCGIATALVFWAMFITMVIYMHFHKRFAVMAPFKSFHKPHLRTMWSMSKHGFTIAMALFFEVSLFSVITLLLAPLGANVVAGHQVALNFSSLVFMLPLSIGTAVSIRVGYYLGQNKADISVLITTLGLTISFILAIMTATITVLFRTELAGSLMFLAALYQLSDSIQVVAAGALRGYKDTRSALYITLFSYWGVGMLLGYVHTYLH